MRADFRVCPFFAGMFSDKKRDAEASLQSLLFILGIEVVDETVDVLVDALHRGAKLGIGTVPVVDDTLIGVDIGQILIGFAVLLEDGLGGGVIVAVHMPLPTDHGLALQQTQGVILVEIAAILLGTNDPTRALGVL